LQANSSSWFTFTGNLSITGIDIDMTLDSIISAPYYGLRSTHYEKKQSERDPYLDNTRSSFSLDVSLQGSINEREMRHAVYKVWGREIHRDRGG
jgi:hypothetical protein